MLIIFLFNKYEIIKFGKKKFNCMSPEIIWVSPLVQSLHFGSCSLPEL